MEQRPVQTAIVILSVIRGSPVATITQPMAARSILLQACKTVVPVAMHVQHRYRMPQVPVPGEFAELTAMVVLATAITMPPMVVRLIYLLTFKIAAVVE